MELPNTSHIPELKFLGNQVTVIIDRPVNSLHPENGMKYELNYGYIPDTSGGDGEEVDAYVIGHEGLIAEFHGVVKAVIVRYDDEENKLVVVPSEYHLSPEEVKVKTHFQEQYFATEIIMQVSLRD